MLRSSRRPGKEKKKGTTLLRLPPTSMFIYYTPNVAYSPYTLFYFFFFFLFYFFFLKNPSSFVSLLPSDLSLELSSIYLLPSGNIMEAFGSLLKPNNSLPCSRRGPPMSIPI